MDTEGYLPISLIASFHRVQALTQDVSLVIQALQQSTLLKIKDMVKVCQIGDHYKSIPLIIHFQKVRTINDPEKWPILPETAKIEEHQPETTTAEPVGESHTEKPVNIETVNTTNAEPAAKAETTIEAPKIEPAKPKPAKIESTKSEGLQLFVVNLRLLE